MSVLLNVANFICLIGTLLQVRAVLKNHAILKGYSIPGSILTLAAVILFNIYFFSIGAYLSVVMGIPTIVFWFSAALFSCINKLKHRGIKT